MDVSIGELDESGHGLATAGSVSGLVQLPVVEQSSKTFYKKIRV